MNILRSRCLVTGATGFIGSRLTRMLVGSGHQVTVLLRPESNLMALGPLADQVSVIMHDGSTGSLAENLAKAAPEVVFHLASQFVAEHCVEQVTQLVDANVRFGAQLLEAMSGCEARLLVNTGSAWEHFDGPGYNPSCLYAATKQAFDAILEYYVQASNFRTITLKLFDTYGPEDPRPKLIPLLLRAERTGEILDMSPGRQLLDLVYVDDVVDAFLVAGERLLRGKSDAREEYTVRSGHPVSLRDLVALLARTGSGLQVRWGGRAYRKREVMIPWNAGKRLPGWLPKINLEEGLRLTRGYAPRGG